MSLHSGRVLAALDRFAAPADREGALRDLAADLGCDELVLFAPDPELGIHLPAPGLPQTLQHPGAWRALIDGCLETGECEGEIAGAEGVRRPARSVAAEGGAVAVAVGAGAPTADLAKLRPLLSLLGSLFVEERRVQAAHVRHQAALHAAARSTALAGALQQLRGKLEAALAETEAANRAKSDFLATMSHELRTPVNAIIGYSQLLEMGLAGAVTPEQTAQIERIHASSRHLLTLINDVLDLSKIEAGHMEVLHEQHDLSNGVGDAVRLLSLQASERQIELVEDCVSRPVQYVGDEDRVRQVVTNLVSNALKFTEPGGRVAVRCGVEEQPPGEAFLTGDGPWTFVQVEDTGIGIAESDLRGVFQAFEQVDAGRRRSRGGIGLGLTISRQLARLMGGDLTVRSELGVGSTFTLWLPSHPVPAGHLDETIRVRRAT
jgi:signal transduction histidine kinase